MPYMSCPICGSIEPPKEGNSRCEHMEITGIVIAFTSYLNKKNITSPTVEDAYKFMLETFDKV